jgi:hypothetical protein
MDRMVKRILMLFILLSSAVPAFCWSPWEDNVKRELDLKHGWNEWVSPGCSKEAYKDLKYQKLNYFFTNYENVGEVKSCGGAFTLPTGETMAWGDMSPLTDPDYYEDYLIDNRSKESFLGDNTWIRR